MFSSKAKKFKDGSTYKGEMAKGKRHGKGQFTSKEGIIYDGEWIDDAMSGVGVMTWPDGKKYFGQWENNEMKGHGIFFTNSNKADANILYGDFMNGKLHGRGVDISGVQGNLKIRIGFDWQNGDLIGGFEIEEKDDKYFIVQTYKERKLEWIEIGELFLSN